MIDDDDDDHLRDTAPFDIPFDSIAAMVDLMVVVAKSDGKIDEDEASALVALINTLNRSVLDRRVTRGIVHESLERLKKDGVRETLTRVGQTLAYLGKLKDALGLGLDVARSGGGMTELEWTSLVLAGRAGGLSAQEIRDIVGDCPPKP
jgi:hypothetical protein